MKDFLKDNFIVIVLAIVGIFGMYLLFHTINRQYEFYDRVLNYAQESNTAVEIK